MWFLFFAALSSVLMWCTTGSACGQEPIPEPLAQEETQKNPSAECLEPPPLLRWQEYNGPFAKMAGSLAKKLERNTAHTPHPPHFKSSQVLCSLEPGDKFRLFVSDTLDPVSFLLSGFNAGLSQAADWDPTFGQGAKGFALRFGAELGVSTSARFLGSFVYPMIFGEDPRYYRLAHAPTGKRLVHAVRHTVIAHRDNGKHMFNFTEWLGTASAVGLNYAFHPGAPDGLGPAVKMGVSWILEDMGFDVLREFWPDIARKLKLPFRGMQYETH